MQLQGLAVISLRVQGIYAADSFRKDVGKGSDAACRAYGQAANEEVRLP